MMKPELDNGVVAHGGDAAACPKPAPGCPHCDRLFHRLIASREEIDALVDNIANNGERTRLMAENEVLLVERDIARAQVDRATKMLASIYSLMNPPAMSANGRTMQFNNPMANDTLQYLSDRIRAIRDETP